MFVGLFEGSVSSIIVAKTFNGSDWLITFVMATPMLANLLGGMWGSVITGRPKLRMFLGLGLATTAVLASVALAPMTQFGGYVFALQILLARGMLAGCITIRSAMWKHNYPVRMRGQIAARLQIVRFSIGIATVLIIAALFDARPDFYIWVYPIGALVGVIGLNLLRPIRVRGERAEIASIRRTRAAAPAVNQRWLMPVRDGWAILRDDADYRQYCTGMMLLGFGNVMLMPVMNIIITKRMDLTYTGSGVLLEVIPRVAMMLSMLPWARMFDRQGAVLFRVRNAYAWTGSAAFGGLGWALFVATPGQSTIGFAFVMTLIVISQISEGLGKGGGAIGWNLGHLHFARPERAEAYMGTHVFLTGLRGLTAPFFGTWLFNVAGATAFAVATVLSISGGVVFWRLAKQQAALSGPDCHQSAGTAMKQDEAIEASQNRSPHRESEKPVSTV
jgi:hypothetical protein